MTSRLRQERRQRGWSQRELSELVGLHDCSTVSRWENRNRRPYRRHAVKLEALFGLSVDALFEDANGTDPQADPATARPSQNGHAPLGGRRDA